MISLSITGAVLLYLSLALGALLTLWLISHLKTRSKQTPPPLHTMRICEYCRFSYLTPTEKEISTCPQCHQLNKMS